MGTAPPLLSGEAAGWREAYVSWPSARCVFQVLGPTAKPAAVATLCLVQSLSQ